MKYLILLIGLIILVVASGQVVNPPPGGGGGGTITSVSGTANQITCSGTPGVTCSIPSTFIAPGTISATTSIDATKLTGNLPAISGASLTGFTAAQIPAAASVFGTGTITVPAGNAVIVGCTSTCAVPVPVPAAGYEICVKNNAGISTVITLNALGSSAMYPKADDSGYGTAGTGTMVSTAAAGNKVCLIGRDATHYELGAVNASANWTVN
jgi:hypothetical protein